MTRYSLLDLVPVVEGGTVAQSLANAADLARHAEAHGYNRYWVAEHHGMRGIASAATAAFGPLAFVALLSTPLARGITGGRPSLTASALVGAVIVVLADFLAAELIPGVRLPTGILTGAAGAPLMLGLLIRSRSRL